MVFIIIVLMSPYQTDYILLVQKTATKLVPLQVRTDVT